jgi:predicted Zn-ribbon and HTH transcriptional regulator
MRKLITNEQVDSRLIGRNIKRIDDYINANSKIRFQCLIESCKHIWATTPKSILYRGTGCPKCDDNNRKITNAQIDDRLVGRNIRRIGNYVNSYTHIDFMCLINSCNHIWSATTNSVVDLKTGCPKCKRQSLVLSNEEIDRRLINRNIKRIDNYITVIAPINFQCNICGYIWNIAPSSIINSDSKCAKCWGNAKINNEDIDFTLNNRNIQRLGDCVNNKTPIDFKCLICNFIWSAAPNDIVNKLTGCPKCQSPKGEKIIIELFEKFNIEFVYQKHIREINGTFPNLKVDFYFSATNLVIEYNGAQHYKAVRFGGISQERADDKFAKQRKRDRLLKRVCKNNNITLICIDGRKYKNIKLKEFIVNEIIPTLPTKNKA